ncbi:hypothetical protein CcI6DRAFT_01332 [Frankia sp. CcI6]|uniref:glycosyltransferase n=1 Tax=unclassified Frankia TaxID=2632575 RepID=UPI0003CFA936|nr:MULTISPECIES: glycosyltransferase [unclassified Frankia]ETA03177.1 hypothetical protein CcI6DRAFT_01332 [Frankia sp. CcI6]
MTTGVAAPGAVSSRVAALRAGLILRGWHVDVLDVPPARRSPIQAVVDRLPPSVGQALEQAGIEGDVRPAVAWRSLPALRAVRHGVVVVSVPPFSLLAAATLIRRGLLVVVDYRDPWSARAHPPALARITGALESVALRRARAVTFAGGPAFGRLLAARLEVPNDKIFSVPNGFDPADLAGVPQPMADRRRDGTPLDLVFGGYWYGRNGPGILATALDRVGPETATLTVVGDAAATIAVRAAREPAISRPALYARLARADAAVITLDHASAVESRIPAKAYDCLAVGIPVIAICPSGAALLAIPGAARFHHIVHDDVDGLVALLRAACADRSLLRPGTQGSGPTRDAGAGSLDKLLREIVS